MANIEILDKLTIDKIAAGEVIERPSSVVKELVENSIDAKATAITVEIKEGGISFIRITDNGSGIDKEQVQIAFLRHSTSKIRNVEDLHRISSLGFRGEALSSIAAVSQVELITKTADEFTGVRYQIEDGVGGEFEEIGAPEGTTFIIRNLFHHTPARKKFLKTPQTEAGYINSLMERLALSHPEISFQLIVNGQSKLHTLGNHRLKDVIYQIYGRDISANLIEINEKNELFEVKGYIGKPIISRGNRNFESYFVNGRYIKSTLLSKAIEDAYKLHLMQHQYPFTVLHFEFNGQLLDINVHPTKMEMRFSRNEDIYKKLTAIVKSALEHKELIPDVSLESKSAPAKKIETKREIAPEPFEKSRWEKLRQNVSANSPYEKKYETKYPSGGMASRAAVTPQTQELAVDVLNDKPQTTQIETKPSQPDVTNKTEQFKTEVPSVATPPNQEQPNQEFQKSDNQIYDPQETVTYVQEELPYEEKGLLAQEAIAEHKIIGQLFDTYWLVQYKEDLFIIDQHAAHEKVLFERTMKQLGEKEYVSQLLSPPIILTLSMAEAALMLKYMDEFTKLGFQIESFGGNEYAVSAVPANLFSLNSKELLIDILDNLSDLNVGETSQIIIEKIAAMSCKSAVKGNQRLSRVEAEALIKELLQLENPYQCPHGRPTIISMSKYELEKKFKRII